MLRNQRGQAAVELLAAVPAVLVAGLAAWQLVLAGHAAWLAAGAARVAARADVVGDDPARAARSALPAGRARALEVERAAPGGVRVRVPLPALHPRWDGHASIAAAASLEVSR